VCSLRVVSDAEPAKTFIDNTFVGKKGWETTGAIIYYLFKHHRERFFPNCKKLVFVSDNGTGFRQTEMLHFWTLFSIEFDLLVRVETLAPYHGYSMADQHASGVGQAVHRRRIRSDLCGSKAVASVITEELGNVAFSYDQPGRKCAMVQNVIDAHIKPGVKIREFQSFVCYLMRGGVETRMAGVVTAGRFSGMAHTCLFDMRISSSTCGKCSDVLLEPVTHPASVCKEGGVGHQHEHKRHADELRGLSPAEVAAGLRAAVRVASEQSAAVKAVENRVRQAMQHLEQLVPAPSSPASSSSSSSSASSASSASTNELSKSAMDDDDDDDEPLVPTQRVKPASLATPSPTAPSASSSSTSSSTSLDKSGDTKDMDDDDDKLIAQTLPAPLIPQHHRGPRKPVKRKEPPTKKAQKAKKQKMQKGSNQKGPKLTVEEAHRVTIVGEKWTPTPKGGKWTEKTYHQRIYIFEYEDGHKSTVVAEDLNPDKGRENVLLADQSEFWKKPIAAWRLNHHPLPRASPPTAQ
jgi:hypothetical protein